MKNLSPVELKQQLELLLRKLTAGDLDGIAVTYIETDRILDKIRPVQFLGFNKYSTGWKLAEHAEDMPSYIRQEIK